MSYSEFKQAIKANGWTLAQLRCDVQPMTAILDFIDQVGMARYERFVLRYERE